MPSYTDQLGRTVHCVAYPQRIVSLVPSQTELLYDLGLDTEVAGITKFCVHPGSWFRSKTRVGGTKTINTAVVDSIQPDLIIANKEENKEEDIEALGQKFPVWISDIKTLEDALQMIAALGELLGKQENALLLARNIEERFRMLADKIHPSRQNRAIYLIWRNPYMIAGNDTFIHDMMGRCGFVNAIPELSRYPEISAEGMRNSGADYVFLSSEPYPFRQAHIDELREYLPQAKIILVDGEMFSWYGSRLLQAPAYFEALCRQLQQ